jgi:hypothetical protein
MTTPSGQISAQDIKNEFGEVNGSVPLGSYRVSQTRGELTLAIGDGVPTSGTISYENMRNKKLNIVVDYFSGGGINRTDNGDNATNAKHVYINDTSKVTVIGQLKSRPTNTSGHKVRIHVNKTIGGKKGGANVCALRTGSWDNGTDLHVQVGSAGKIYGGGGDGGEGGNTDDAGNRGQDGASALGLNFSAHVNVASGGLLRCGFGGGGGGGSGRQQDKGGDRRAGGGGGGGGAGFPGGSGGDRGRTHVDGGDGTAGNLNTAGDGGGGGNNHNQAYGGTGGEGGQQGEGANTGDGAQYGSQGGGNEGSAIRRAGGTSLLSLTNNGSIIGATNQTGVS